MDWKGTLGSQWRQYEETFPVIARSSIDQVSLECRNSRVPIELMRLLDGKDVLVGAIDVATSAVETPEEVAATIREALRFVAPEKLYPCTNCGMAPMRRRWRTASLPLWRKGLRSCVMSFAASAHVPAPPEASMLKSLVQFSEA